MNVIDNLHPISPVGGSLPAGGSAHAGHAYFASLITPFVTGDFLGVPQPSNYANKMKQPIVEAPSVTWKSAGPGKKRLKLTKKPDGTYGLAPEDDSFDGFLDYGGDPNIPPPPPPPPGVPQPPGARPTSADEFHTPGNIADNDYYEYANPIVEDNYGNLGPFSATLPDYLGLQESMDNHVQGEDNYGFYPSTSTSRRSSISSRRSSTASRREMPIYYRRDSELSSLADHHANIGRIGSSRRSSSSDSLPELVDLNLNPMVQPIDVLEDLPGQLFDAKRIKTPSLRSASLQSSGSGAKSSSSGDDQPGPSGVSTPANVKRQASPTTFELMDRLGKTIRDTSAANIQETPAGAGAMSNDYKSIGTPIVLPNIDAIAANAFIKKYREIALNFRNAAEGHPPGVLRDHYYAEYRRYQGMAFNELRKLREGLKSDNSHLARQSQAPATPMSSAQAQTELSPEALKDLESERREEERNAKDKSYKPKKDKGKGRKK